MPKGWFGPKIAGNGVRTWQGWVVIATFIAGLFAIPKFVVPDLAPLLKLHPGEVRAILSLIWVAALLTIVWATYDPDA